MNLDCTDPGKLDGLAFGGVALLLILNGIFCVAVVQLRGWLALLPLSFPHIYTFVGAFLLLWGFDRIFPEALANGAPTQAVGFGLYLILFALAVRWARQRFGFSWGVMAMQFIMLGLTLLILTIAVYTPDSSEVTWPYCDTPG